MVNHQSDNPDTMNDLEMIWFQPPVSSALRLETLGFTLKNMYLYIYIYIYWKYRGSLKIDNYFLGQIDLKLRQKGWQNHRRNSRNLISRALWPANLAAEPVVNSVETKKPWHLCRQVVWQSVRSSYGQAKLGQMCRQVARQRMWTCCGQAKIWTFFNCKMWWMQMSMKAQSRTCFTVEQGSFLVNIFPLAASGNCEKRFFDCQIATRIADTWQESGTNLAETCALETWPHTVRRKK